MTKLIRFVVRLCSSTERSLKTGENDRADCGQSSHEVQWSREDSPISAIEFPANREPGAATKTTVEKKEGLFHVPIAAMEAVQVTGIVIIKLK